MTPQRYQKVKEVFAEACRLEHAARTAFLDEACAADGELRAEVESLLAHDGSLALEPQVGAADLLGFCRMDLDPLDSAAASPSLALPNATFPSRIGPFEITREIGHGGMGVVYEARQKNPQRTIALKVIRPGVASEQLLRRFEFEAHVLGQLQHPGIAQIYEAGTATVSAPGGIVSKQPYFAMEYVYGRPLLDVIADPHPGVRERLKLFANICDAVQHAHQKGVIHRDLKPGNILVGDDGQPKILDFGVARLADSDVRSMTLQTAAGQVIGTIPYMSPEQISGRSHDLDTRSDIYALGVIFYQMLARKLPYDLEAKSIPEAARAIAEQAPTRLSTSNRTFRGDIETIVAKALEKDRERRYQSASDLAADIRRYLSDQPILARPATTIYQLRKFARRNRALVLAVTGTFVALSGALGYVTWERNRAVEAERLAEQRRGEAERQTAIANVVNDFLNHDLLGAANPQEQGRDVTVLEALDRAARMIEGKFKDEPLVEASIRTTLALTYQSLGKNDSAERHATAALELRRQQLDEEHPDTLAAMNNLAIAHKCQGHFEEAEALYVAVLDARRRAHGTDHPETLSTMNNLALLYGQLGRSDAAQTMLAETLERRRLVLGADHVDTLGTTVNLANLLCELGHYAEAETLYREALDAYRRTVRDDYPDAIRARAGLARLHVDQGHFEKAEPLLVQTLNARRRVLGNEHPGTLSSMDDLARLYEKQGQPEKAESLYIETVELKRRVLGEEHPHTLNALNNLANLYARQGRFAEAEPLQRELLEARRRTLGREHPRTMSILNNLAAVYCLQGSFEEAEPLLVEALELQRRVLGDEHPKTLISKNNLALLYKDLGRLEDSLALQRETLETRRRVLGEEHPHTLVSAHNLASVLATLGRLDEADRVFRHVVDVRRRVLGDEHPDTLDSMSRLATLCCQQEHFEEAELLATRTAEISNRTLGADHESTVQFKRVLSEVYAAWGKPEKAAQWRAQLPTTQPGS